MIDIIMISTTETLKDALTKFSTYQFSRLPVYESNHDNVIGMIYQKDIFALLSKGEDKSLVELIRPVIFVPENMKSISSCGSFELNVCIWLWLLMNMAM